MAAIKCKSVKPDTLAILCTHKGKAGSPFMSEEVYIERRVMGQVTLYTNSGPMVLETNSVDATVFTDPTRPDMTFRLRTVEENVA